MENIIDVRDLYKKYKAVQAVAGIDFQVKRGEIFAFLGPNGAGKSTTIRMLTTLEKGDQGRIMIDGVDAAKAAARVRQSFGIVFQDPSLDNELTAYENMYFHSVLYKVVAKERKSKIEELLRMVELWEKKDLLVKTFSGGMKRRLEIARGLLHHPKILFLDEPTLGLDPQTRNRIWDYIKNKNQQDCLTVFFTTHYMDEVERVADQVAIIDLGRIIARGTVAQIRDRSGAKDMETAFLKLTGKQIRDEKSNGHDWMRRQARK